MKRALTGIAAAAVVLGAASPLAFAATSTTGLTQAGQLPIVVNGQVLSNPYEMTGVDSGNTTGFFPIYYFNQALAKIGFTATWDGNTHTWAITAPNVDASQISVAGGVGTGNTTVTVNGTVVKKFNTQVAKDPAGGKNAQATTYLPIYYINNVLTALGVKGSFSGQTGLSITGGAQATGVPSVGAVTFSGNAAGNGQASSPAVSYGAPITVSAMLSDANGNPVAGVNTTLTLVGSTTPTVTVNGVNANNTSTTPGTYTYNVPTNAQGVASAQINVPSGVSASYSVQFSAPYNNSNGQAITDSKAYLEIVAGNTMAISPYSTTGYAVPVSTAANSTAGLVPVTVTLPQLNGAPQAGVAVTFNLNNPAAFFANSQGSAITTSTSTTAYTDSQGQATVYVNSTATISSLTVTATAGSYTASTVLSYGNAGAVTQIPSTSYAAAGVNGGTAPNWTANNNATVTISGTAEDVLGNPVANAQLLVTGTGGDYVTGSGSSATKTAFPNATPVNGSTVSSTGAPFGEIVTTDANGNFSFQVTDSGESDTYKVWAVANGAVNSAALATFSVNFSASSSTVSSVGVATGNGLYTSWSNNSSAPVTSLNGIQFAGTTESSSSPNVVTSPISYVEVGAFDGSNNDFLGDNTTSSVTYQISASNNGFIDSIDGVRLDGTNAGLPNKASSVDVQVQPYTPTSPTANHSYLQLSVNGVTIGYIDVTDGTTPTAALATVADLPSGVAAQPAVSAQLTKLPADLGMQLASGKYLLSALNVGVGDTHAETTTITASVGSVSGTVQATFAAGSATQLVANPSYASPSVGVPENVTLTVEDTNGNPVSNAPITLNFSAADTKGLWLTSVNGAQLTQNIGPNGASEPTPVPLWTTGLPANLNYNVVVPGVVSYNNDASSITLWTGASGTVELGLQDNDANYWSTPASPGVASIASDTSDALAGGTVVEIYTNQNGSSYTFGIDTAGNLPGTGTNKVDSTLQY